MFFGAERFADLGEFGDDLAAGQAGGHVQPDAAQGLAPRGAAQPELLEARDAALRPGAAGFDALANPHLFLGQQLVGLGADDSFLRELFFLLQLVLGEVARVGAQLAAVELDDARCDTVKEGAVVRDRHHAALEVDEEVLEPLDRVQVQVVGRLVEQQHVGAAHQGLAQRDAFLRPAGQGADHHVLVQVQALQGFLHALLPVPAVLGLDLPLQRVEVALAVGVLVDQCDDIRHPGERRLEDGGARIEHRFLGDVGDPKPLLQLQHPVIDLFEPRQDLEQRGFAGAVAPDEADPLTSLQGEIGVIEQGHVAEGQLRIEECDEGHEARDYPACTRNAPPIAAAHGSL